MKALRALLLSVLLLAACQASAAGEGGTSAAVTSLQNKGSDTMVNLALAWAEAYQAEHPEVSLSVTGGGSGTGIAALINRTVDLANASRAMKDEERAQAQAAGFEPVEFMVARDAIGVIVNPENPVMELTLGQIADIYTGRVSNWSELGGEDRPIVRLSRETNSGTHVYFLETVIRLGDKTNPDLFSTDTLLLPSSEVIINEVTQNPNAIGYDGLGYIPTDGTVKVLAVGRDLQSGYVLPSIATVQDGSYPIARDLYMYTAGEPAGALRDYLDWILSDEAQAIVAAQGFVPIR